MARKVSDKTGYYYYFQSNGQAYTKGYLKFKHTNNKTYIFYFQSNGQAYTGGWLISGGKKYYFDSKGHGDVYKRQGYTDSDSSGYTCFEYTVS